jgi:TonB-linked SusC/RagA family outer membrane protein
MKKNDMMRSHFMRALLKWFIMIKMLWIIIVSSVIQVSAGTSLTYSQTVRMNLKLNKVNLEQVIWSIKNQTEFSFFYSTEEVRKIKGLDVDMENVTAEEVLDQCLKGTNLTYEIVNKAVIIKSLPLAKKVDSPLPAEPPQKKGISGTVKDTKGIPLPGVTVLVKGTIIGAITDANGVFSFSNAPAGATLIFSFIGMKSKEINMAGVSIVNVIMEEEIKGMDEVQVIGYGRQKKTTLVGSVSTVALKEIQRVSTPSLSNALGGKLAGVITRQTSGEPGYDAAKIYIRGLVSQSGSNKPLIIVDGSERELQDYWTTMNVQEIESFSILKDASATAVYGNRGANGVILITTKHGIIGSPKVTFRSEAAVVTPLRIEDNINGYEYASLINESRLNVGQPAKYSDAEIQKFKDHSDPYIYPDVDWYDVVFRKHTRQMMNNLGVSGGTAAVKYYVNLGYTLQEGIYNEDPNNTYKTNAALKRYNFRSNTDIQLTKNFSIDLGLSGIMSSTNFPGSGAGRIFDVLKLTEPNLMPIKNPNGSAPGAFGDSNINPYSVITQTGYTRQFYNTIVSNLGANWDLSSITKGLSLKGLATFDDVDITQNVRQKTPATFQYIKDPNTGAETYKPIATETDLGYYTLNENYRTIYGEIAANYARTFGKHAISGLLLANRREYVNVNAGGSIGNLPARRQGAVSRITYNYNSKYLVELNGAYTGSENFPKGKQYGFFPSVGAGWIISNEKFWNKDIINVFKLRGTYGLVGNDQIGGDRFLFQTTFNKSAAGYTFGLNQNVNIGGKSEARIGNMNVTWETAYKSNAGIDVELFDGKFTLSGDAFYERREGQLLVRGIIPLYTGYPSGTIPYGNVGITTNKGLEGSVQIRNTTRGGFYYSFNGNFTFAKNVIIENDQPDPLYPWQTFKGQAIGANLGYVALGMFKDQADIDNSPSQTFLQSVIRPGDIKYKDLNNDGVINIADRTIIGKYGSEPQIMFGFGSTIAWKGFDASIFFTGVARRDFFLTQQWTAWPFMGGERYNVMQMVYDNRWIAGADNSKAKFPAVRSMSTNNYIGSTLWQRNGDYLRLKNAEIGYTLPEKISKKISVSNLRVFVQGTNLATWDHIKAIDPESNFGTGGYPIPQNLNFGLEVTF